MRGRWLVGLSMVVFAGLAGTLFFRSRPSAAPQILIAGEDAGYIPSTACAGCHKDIWDKFKQTGMGRSMTKASSSSMPTGFAEGVTVYHAASDRHYQLRQQDGRYYQRRHQIGPDGTEINVFEREIHYVVGSGNHARTFLSRSGDGRLLELPLAWYAEGGGTWAMNPGYDRPDHPDFRREVAYECVFCHTAYPELPPGGGRVGSEPLFPGRIPEGIDCQRCHGPGRNHVQAAAGADKDKIRKAIVNPARLPAGRQLDICMQCHLETTSSRLPHAILRWSRPAFSFRAGESLGDYMVHFDHAPGTGRDEKFEIASQAYRFRKSLCFQRSQGRLSCTTCHDPHGPARREPAIAACRSCHQASLARRTNHPNGPDCISCHMPQRRTEDVVHAVMTDHFIQRRPPPGDLLAPRKERPDTQESAYQGPVVLYYPSQIEPESAARLYLAVAQVKQFSNLDQGIPQLADLVNRQDPDSAPVYLDLAEACRQVGQTAEAIRYYQEALRYDPDFHQASLGLAETLTKSGQAGRAVTILRTLTAKDPSAAAAWNYLGLAQLQEGSLTDAMASFRRAIEARPEFPEALNNLGGALAQSGDRAGAKEMNRAALRLQPDLVSAHLNLTRLADHFGEAAYHWKQALFYQPDNAGLHHEFGLALAGEERFGEALTEFEQAVRLRPDFAEALAGLGDMLSMQNRLAEAIPYYQKALRYKPGLESARMGLEAATGLSR